MNFLAHAYLSGNNESIIVGNFIADHVKGKVIGKYAEGIRKGILLHRRIDGFTDSHPTVKQSTARLKHKYGKYSGVIIDMYYDHFLARNWNNYCDQPLKQFTSGIYKVMMKHFLILPPKTKKILPFMMTNDWMAAYAYLEGLNLALTGMSRRTNFNSGMEHAVDDLKADYDLFLKEFREFFDDLRNDTAYFFSENGYNSAEKP